MKIAIVCQPSDRLLPPNQTPAGQWSYQVAARLSNDIDITIFGRKSAQQSAPVIIEESPHHRGRFRLRFVAGLPDTAWRSVASAWRALAPASFSAHSLIQLPYVVNLAREIKRDKFDIVHIHSAIHFVPIIRRFNPHSRIVLHVHALDRLQRDPERTRRYLEQCDRIFATSDELTRHLQARFPQLERVCQTVTHGVEVAAFRPPDRVPLSAERRLLAMVAQPAQSEMDDLLSAFRLVRQTFGDVVLDVVVTGEQPINWLDGLISAEPHVTLHHSLSSDQLHACIQQAYLVVEAAPRNYPQVGLLMAGSCGLPAVVMGRDGQHPLVEDRRTGYVVEAGSVEAFAARVGDLLRHANVQRQVGAAARRRIGRNFSWRRVSRVALYAYRTLLADGVHSAETDSVFESTGD